MRPRYLHLLFVEKRQWTDDYEPLQRTENTNPRIIPLAACEKVGIYFLALLNDSPEAPKALASMSVALDNEKALHLMPFLSTTITPFFALLVRESTLPADIFVHERVLTTGASLKPDPSKSTRDIVDDALASFSADQARMADAISVSDFVEVVNGPFVGLIGKVARYGTENCILDVPYADNETGVHDVKRIIVPLRDIRRAK